MCACLPASRGAATAEVASATRKASAARRSAAAPAARAAAPSGRKRYDAAVIATTRGPAIAGSAIGGCRLLRLQPDHRECDDNEQDQDGDGHAVAAVAGALLGQARPLL